MKTKSSSVVLTSSLFLLAFSFLAGCTPYEEGRIVAAKGYEQPASAEVIPIMGRTFYSHASSGYAFENAYKAMPDLAMFRHPWLEVQPRIAQNDIASFTDPGLPKNAWTNFPVRITEVLDAPYNKWVGKRVAEFEKQYPGHPITFSCHGARPMATLKDTPFKTDRADFAKWRAAHPSFFGFCAFDEYDNDAQGMTWVIPEKCHDEALLKRYMRQYQPPKTYGFLRQWVDVDYEKTVSYHFGCKDLYGLWSVTPSVGHQIARKGVNFLFYEAEHGSTSGPWRWGAVYARGAARQFHTTFGWYSAMFTNNSLCRDGSSPEGKNGVQVWRDGFTYWPNPEQPKRVPHLGSSRSLLRRNVRYGYLIGSIQSLIECGNHSMWATAKDGKGWTLSPYGEDYNDVFRWHENHERGSVYAPVAFLTSIDENLNRQCWNLFPAKDEGTIPAFLFTLVPTKTSSPTVFAEPKLGREGCMYNSEFGEIADIVCPDAEQPHDTFTDFLCGYKAAFLIGYHNRRTLDREALDEYVARGGTLFCSYDQVADRLVSEKMAGVAFGDGTVKAGKTLLSETGEAVETFEEAYTLHVATPKGAVPFLKDENGAVVAWASAYGEGRVVTVTARRMMPDCFGVLKEDGWKHTQFCNSDLHRRMAAGTLRFPIVHYLLKRVQDDVMPIRVAGDIQWGLNRVKGLGQRSRSGEGLGERSRSGEGLGQRSRSTEEESNIHCSTSNLQPSTSSSWLLWLINNNGVTKFALEPEELDLTKTSTVTVDLKDLKGAKVYDITAIDKTVPIEVKDGKFSVQVKPGEDVRLSIVP